ncbi:GNAT family N-acetyltransferase [Macrococcus animalis]|uniref:GNAT family N-acetyltransferase n=1 Tax=Macrococcus animalis TaxID=3395467 RepID=UPI0039BDE032
MRYNEFNQPIGNQVKDFQPGILPNIQSLVGETVTIEKISEKHFDDLFEVYGTFSSPENLTYMPIRKFENKDEYKDFLIHLIASEDPHYLTIIDNATKKAVGTFSLMRIDNNNRVVEMGWVVYSPILKRSRQATEAQYLVMKYVFEELKYRRYEWKCDSLNEASNKSAKRLGFTFEGTFRQVIVYKGRNRDTNWYSIIDKEWPKNKERLEAWLDDSNFDAKGNQKQSLNEMINKESEITKDLSQQDIVNMISDALEDYKETNESKSIEELMASFGLRQEDNIDLHKLNGCIYFPRDISPIHFISINYYIRYY